MFSVLLLGKALAGTILVRGKQASKQINIQPLHGSVLFMPFYLQFKSSHWTKIEKTFFEIQESYCYSKHMNLNSIDQWYKAVSYVNSINNTVHSCQETNVTKRRLGKNCLEQSRGMHSLIFFKFCFTLLGLCCKRLLNCRVWFCLISVHGRLNNVNREAQYQPEFQNEGRMAASSSIWFQKHFEQISNDL